MEKPQKLSSGRYRARIFRDGKKVSLGTYATGKEAVEAQAKALVAKDEGKGNILFWRYAEAWLQAEKHRLSKGTWDNYVRSYKLHLEPTFGKKKLTDITPTMVRRWWAGMEAQEGPRRAAYTVLSGLMRQAEDDGEIQKWTRIRGGFANVAKKRPQVSVEDVKLIRMLATDDVVRTVVHLQLSSGLRIGESLALDWEDIDLQAGTIHVYKRDTKFGRAEGRKAHKDADVYQPVDTGCVQVLKELKEKGTGTGAVFVNSKGARLTYSAWWRRWDAIRKESGMTHVHIHDVRSVHLTAFAAHATLAELMERGGHRDIRSAMVYQRPGVERQAALVKELEGVF